MVHTQEGSVLCVSTKFKVNSSIRSKVVRRDLEIGSLDPGHAHLEHALYSVHWRGLSSTWAAQPGGVGDSVPPLLGPGGTGGTGGGSMKMIFASTAVFIHYCTSD